MDLLRPRRLAPGQTVGMVAPSAAPNDPERIRFAIDTVESLGFKVKAGAHLFDREGYLAGADAARAADLNAMFADDGVDAIWCVRGGYGASRILPALDYPLMQRKPKPLIGYSDITALHMAIHRHARLVTFHGPVAFRAFTPYTLGEIRRVLWTGETPTRLGAPPPFERAEGRVDWDNRVSTLVGGKARGRLLGGN
ncbi:MAG TPA: LD-carboxypeptidase, partial [Methylomirabilota bacterium]